MDRDTYSSSSRARAHYSKPVARAAHWHGHGRPRRRRRISIRALCGPATATGRTQAGPGAVTRYVCRGRGLSAELGAACPDLSPAGVVCDRHGPSLGRGGTIRIQHRGIRAEYGWMPVEPEHSNKRIALAGRETERGRWLLLRLERFEAATSYSVTLKVRPRHRIQGTRKASPSESERRRHVVNQHPVTGSRTPGGCACTSACGCR